MTPPVFLVPDWPLPPNVRAVTTTRTGGVSQGEYTGFNLAGHVGDHPDHVATNRTILAEALQLPAQPVWLSQVHGVDVLRHDGETSVAPPHEYDACYSNQPAAVCAVLTADCLPVFFCSRDGKEIAVAHAGWRGLVDGVLATSLSAFLCPHHDVLVYLGPAIGPASFEVGDDVRERFLTQWQTHGEQAVAACFVPQIFAPQTPAVPRRWLCDIYQLARLQLGALGVEAIDGGGEDTCADGERFYSFRRDGSTGRMASLIWRTA